MGSRGAEECWHSNQFWDVIFPFAITGFVWTTATRRLVMEGFVSAMCPNNNSNNNNCKPEAQCRRYLYVNENSTESKASPVPSVHCQSQQQHHCPDTSLPLNTTTSWYMTAFSTQDCLSVTTGTWAGSFKLISYARWLINSKQLTGGQHWFGCTSLWVKKNNPL